MKQEDIDAIKEFSGDNSLNLLGCGHGKNYYGVKQPYTTRYEFEEKDPELYQKFKKIEDILKRYIAGFVSFANFTDTDPNKLRYMLDYNHGTSASTFVGVDYIPLELLYTFEELDKCSAQ